jgi:NitT/TauT family transport system substrate-binding protein
MRFSALALVAIFLLSACGGTSALPSNASVAATGSGTSGSAQPVASSPLAAANAPLKLGANATSVDSTFVFLTQSAGIFAKNGLSVDIEGMNGSASMNALVGGDLDAVLHSGTQLIVAGIANGSPLKIVAVISNVYNAILVAPTDITSLDQLRGKKVGAPSGTSVQSQGVRHALANLGLTAGKDYQLIETGTNGGVPGTMAALLARQVDAAGLDDQFSAKAVAQGGYHVLLDLADPSVKVSTAAQTLTFRTQFIDQHPDVVQKTVDSLMEGVRYMKEHKAESEALMKSRSKIDDQASLDQSYDRQVELLAKAPVPQKDQFTDIIATLPKDTPSVTDAMLNTFLDTKYVDDAVNRGLANY